MEGGREGDWECSGCKNRNYAFRCFCNRCKQPRTLVDPTTPPHSKWLPRPGDWICSGCTNNNYASRENCKKCGRAKDAVAMPAFALPGVYPGAHGALHPSMGVAGTSTFQHPTLPLGGPIVPHGHSLNQIPAVPGDWRDGVWICDCGFHNYSSRTQCKKCNAAPPALGNKRLATDELVYNWDNKRLNAGGGSHLNSYLHSYPGLGPMVGLFGAYPNGNTAVPPSMQGPLQMSQLQTVPSSVGKGAKNWRDGDWMCSNCSNHNYASRSECNRCKTQKNAVSQPVGVA